MVVLEAAAIGAAGYGLYKGGEAGVRKGQDLHKEYQRETNRMAHRGELNQKTQQRKDRISKIMSMRRGTATNTNLQQQQQQDTAAAAVVDTADVEDNSSWLLSGSNASSRRQASTSTSTSNSNTPVDINVNDRHKVVMAKLRSSRRDEAQKNKKKGGVFNGLLFNTKK